MWVIYKMLIWLGVCLLIGNILLVVATISYSNFVLGILLQWTLVFVGLQGSHLLDKESKKR